MVFRSSSWCAPVANLFVWELKISYTVGVQVFAGDGFAFSLEYFLGEESGSVVVEEGQGPDTWHVLRDGHCA